jgi:CPA2 family monovalent cation:H+ antiporter-2
VQDQRDARYNLLRGYFHGSDDDTLDELKLDRLITVTLPPVAKSIGKPLSFLALDSLGVRIVNVRHRNGQAISLPGNSLLQDGDTLVLSGKAQALAIAEQKLMRG